MTEAAPITSVPVAGPVWIVSVSHRHGGDAWACASTAGACASLADYCRQWWGDDYGVWPTVGDDPYGEIIDAPDDDGACIAAYFGSMESESYDIVQGVLNP